MPVGRVSLPCNLSHDACDVPIPLPMVTMTDGHLRKHYLTASSFVGGNKRICVKKKTEWRVKLY